MSNQMKNKGLSNDNNFELFVDSFFDFSRKAILLIPFRRRKVLMKSRKIIQKEVFLVFRKSENLENVFS